MNRAICGDNIITVEQAKKMYAGMRNLEIESKNGIVESVSYKSPCLLCGKYHQWLSKASKRCNIRLVGMVMKVIKED